MKPPELGAPFCDARGTRWRVARVVCVEGVPVPKRAPQIARGPFPRLYQHAGSRAYRDGLVMPAASTELPPIAGPVRCDIDLVFKRPQRLFVRRHGEHRARHIARPDADNGVGMLLDGMTDAGVWRDDSQVCAMSIWKWYGAVIGRRPNRCEGAHALVVVSVPA